MKRVTVIPAESGGSSFVVGDNAAARGNGTGTAPKGFILSLSVDYGSLSEAVTLPDAESSLFFDRKNETSNVSVVADYGFDSEFSRDYFMLTLQDKIPLLAHVSIEVDGFQCWLPQASTRPITAEPIGQVACIVRYQFSGQKLQSGQPDTVT